MAISWKQTITTWGNTGGSTTTTATSGSYTPVSTGDQLVSLGYFVVSGATGGQTLTFTSNQGAANQFSSQAAILQPTTGDWTQWYMSGNVQAPSQTQTEFVTATSGTAFWVMAWGFEYSGVVNTSSVNATLRSAPGTGSGAITGISVSVPTGGILLAMCMNRSNHTTAISSPTGTNRGQGTQATLASAYCVTEYAGAGANIQPTFTDATNGGTDFYVVVQIVLNPSQSLADDADVSAFHWIQEGTETGDEIHEYIYDAQPVQPFFGGQFFNIEVEM